MVTSLGLNNDWDIYLDTNNNLATIRGEMRANQDVCTAIRLFKGEAILDVNKGIPYFVDILGGKPGAALVADFMRKQALDVPDVKTAIISNIRIQDRTVDADINITYGGE